MGDGRVHMLKTCQTDDGTGIDADASGSARYEFACQHQIHSTFNAASVTRDGEERLNLT
jgi:hypothetical protein